MSDRERLRRMLAADARRLREINRFLLDPSNAMIDGLLDVVERTAGRARSTGRRRRRAGSRTCSPGWTRSAPRTGRTSTGCGASATAGPSCRWRSTAAGLGAEPRVGGAAARQRGDPSRAVTLEISALQFFPWLIAEARQAIERRELMPGRYIRVRRMAEQVADQGDTLAVAAAMRIIGASHVETLDTKGTDGSNVHLGGPETITGYFGGVGQPNDYPLKWIDEYLGYYTRYGIRQVLNVNPGTVLAAYLLHRLGVDCEFKISVFVGNDNPWSVLWTLHDRAPVLAPRRILEPHRLQLLQLREQRDDPGMRPHPRRPGPHPAGEVRAPHHRDARSPSCASPTCAATSWSSWPGPCRTSRPSTRAATPRSRSTRAHPSDILDYFFSKEEIEAKGLMPAMLTNYLDKHESREPHGRGPAAGGDRRGGRAAAARRAEALGGHVLPAAAARE